MMQTKRSRDIYGFVQLAITKPIQEYTDEDEKFLRQKWVSEADFLEWREQLKHKLKGKAVMAHYVLRHYTDKLSEHHELVVPLKEVLAELDRKEQTK